MDCLYVVMWEEWDGTNCRGGDMFYSFDPDKAVEFMHTSDRANGLTWREELDMYVYHGRYAWEKMYVDVRPLDEEV